MQIRANDTNQSAAVVPPPCLEAGNRGVKDMPRAIENLETRSDIDSDTFAFFSYSWGEVNGPTALAQEPRLRLAVIDIEVPPMAANPDVALVNALPRVRVPLLLLSAFDARRPWRMRAATSSSSAVPRPTSPTSSRSAVILFRAPS
jgi:hypothetical protein